MDVLFASANWLLLAKLHIHSESTLSLLKQATKDYGSLVRKFQRDTSHIKTVETPSEVQARQRRAEKAAQKSGILASSTRSAAQPKPLNINTFKHHQGPHTVDAILEFGATGSYSTFRVSNFPHFVSIRV